MSCRVVCRGLECLWAYLFLQDLHMLLVDDIQLLEFVVLVLRAPESTLVTDAVLTGLTVHTHLLVMDRALLLL